MMEKLHRVLELWKVGLMKRLGRVLDNLLVQLLSSSIYHNFDLKSSLTSAPELTNKLTMLRTSYHLGTRENGSTNICSRYLYGVHIIFLR